MKVQVLILCIANSARSQMGEGLLRDISENNIDVYSAGTKPSTVNPFAIQAMRKRNIDITTHTSDSFEKYLNQPFDYVITVCDNAAETCPNFPGKAQRIHWNFTDPAGVDGDEDEILASFIKVRDGLEERISEWIAKFTKI